jgi:tetratricopeptide (TPR) repeat protein
MLHRATRWRSCGGICFALAVAGALTAAAPCVAQAGYSSAEAEALIASDSANPQVYLTASQYAQRRGDPAAAAAVLERGRAHARPSAELLVALADAYYRLERLADAENVLVAAVELAPDYSPAYEKCAELQWRSGRRTDAVASLERSVAADPRAISPSCRLVYCLAAMGRAEDAERRCREFLARHSESAGLWIALGEAQESQNRLQEAFASYGHALALDDRAAAAHSRRGRLFCLFSQYEAAADACRRALAIDNEDPVAHAYLGIACAELGLDWEAQLHAAVAEQQGMAMDVVWKKYGQ